MNRVQGKMFGHVVTEDCIFIHPVPTAPPFGIAFFCGVPYSAGFPLHGIFFPQYPYLKAKSLNFRLESAVLSNRTLLSVSWTCILVCLLCFSICLLCSLLVSCFLVTGIVFLHSKPCCTHCMSCQINDYFLTYRQQPCCHSISFYCLPGRF